MASKLITPAEMPWIEGLQIPQDFYWVLREPAPLAGMAYPEASTPWAAIAAAGFRRIVCLTEDSPGYNPTPLEIAYAARLEDLYGGKAPSEPFREERLVREAAVVVEAALKAGQGMVIHCYGGTGRTGTLIGCVLRGFGFSGARVLAYLDELNQARGEPGWPESTWQAEFVMRCGSENVLDGEPDRPY